MRGSLDEEGMAESMRAGRRRKNGGKSYIPARFGLDIRGASLMMHSNVMARYAARTKTKTIALVNREREKDECVLDMYFVQRSTRDKEPTIAE